MSGVAIICLGNRFVPGDNLGCRVFDHLSEIPSDIDIIDGGLCGLDLLRLLDKKHRVVFVDVVTGMGETGDIVVLDRERIASHASHYGHGAGLPYLLEMMPHVCPPPWPDIALVGATEAVDDALIRALARRSLEVATYGTA